MPRFVVHDHRARTHHHDVRLERDGVLVSWAVPKGLPERAGERRLAIRTPDHPLSYIDFAGTIPQGSYGAGEVSVHDHGEYDPVAWTADRIEVRLHGTRFAGLYLFVPFRRAGPDQWLVFRAEDRQL
ncbi:MAG TPA: ATP-dependent DNA ligase [Methanoregulaceae archaeon]|nr:ATP-dependent DNA ligase [Methanoregulaceae archaeon]